MDANAIRNPSQMSSRLKTHIHTPLGSLKPLQGVGLTLCNAQGGPNQRDVVDLKRSSFRDCLRVLHLCAQRRSAPVTRGARCVKSDAEGSTSKIFLTTVAKNGAGFVFLFSTALYCSAAWHTSIHVVTVTMLALLGGIHLLHRFRNYYGKSRPRLTQV